jgi:uncharacterized heparinase superfamily protein
MARAPRPPAVLHRLPAAALAAFGRRLAREWRNGPLHRLSIAGPAPAGFAVRARDLRPGDPAAGARLLRGEFQFGGEGVQVAPGGDPWARAAPSRRFALALHGFGWARDLLTQGEPGARELLRLWLEWRRLFGAFNAFAWSGLALERRVFNLASAGAALAPVASEAEAAAFVESLARQARRLLTEPGDPSRAAERATAAALVGAALSGKAGERLLDRALPRLADLIADAVPPDGVHDSRAPERGLELLFDLLALDDALSQAGAPAPMTVARALDRLAAGVRFFALGDGRLASFHGGEAGGRALVAAALALEAAASQPPKSTAYGRFHRLEGRSLQVIVDTGAPPADAWSGAACAQLAAIAVDCEGRRLIVGSAWSAKAEVGGALRGPAGGSCLALGAHWPGAVLRRGLLAGDLGERLEGGPSEVIAERRQSGREVWLDVSHDGWRAAGFDCVRRLYVDEAAGELRGEDVLTPFGRSQPAPTPLVARFHLAPDVAAQIAVDGKSAVLRPPGVRGWRLRGDGAMRLDPGVVFEEGEPRATQVLSLQGTAHRAEGGRLRWKLAPDE